MAFTGRADGGILDGELDGADLGTVLRGFDLQMFEAGTPIQTQLIGLIEHVVSTEGLDLAHQGLGALLFAGVLGLKNLEIGLVQLEAVLSEFHAAERGMHLLIESETRIVLGGLMIKS